MKFDVNAPPKLTGKATTDIPLLHNWCAILHRKLGGMLRRVENEQIASVSGDKVDISTGSIKGASVNISSDYFFVGNDANYIKFENGVLEVKTS
jgi:hypothetical protein